MEKPIVMTLDEDQVARLEAFRDQVLEYARQDSTGRLEELYNRIRIFLEENKKP